MIEHPLRCFIGWDSKEPIAFSVAVSSLIRHASHPLIITPLVQDHLRSEGLYTRERKPNEATEFSLTRFLTPHLSEYQGFSVFMDCDVLVQTDIYDLLFYPMAYPGKAIYVCHHDYIPKDLIKFDGHEQATYPRKNHSSVMLFDNAKCHSLTPEYVNAASGLELHRFHWLAERQIGHLPLDWNWLVGEYPPNPDAKILHFTNGTPCFHDYATCDHAEDWWDEYRRMLAPARATEQAMARVQA
jgi:lipopolysaccharide biosynthesis glycosyltransferase